MSTNVEVTRATIWEDGEATNLARITGQDAAAITQASLTSVHYAVYNGATVVQALTELTVANVVFDTLQTGDARWTVDSTGFNFEHQIAASLLSSPDTSYRVEYKFTFTDATKTYAVFILYTRWITQS